MKAGECRPGQGVKMDGKSCVVTSIEHRTPGNLRAFVQIKIKDIMTGKHVEKRFNPADDIESITLDRSDLEYLYTDTDGAVFMNPTTFDQITVPETALGDVMLYLRPNTLATILSIDGVPAAVEPPTVVVLTVTETEPGIKGATATNQLKPATCETGLSTRVPPFIDAGEEIRVSTADGSYLSRSTG
ncbi:MAG: elongation factor P [Phycisphaeraceae bacterium]